VSFGRQNDVYAAMGRSLAAFMTSSAAQDTMTGYLRAQWVLMAGGIEDRTGLRTAGTGLTPFSSMGSATVSLGRDRFARYASQRLARASVDHLLRAHYVGREVPEKIRPEDALADAAKDAWEWFVEACALNELTEAKNQVIDTIRPPDRPTRLDAVRAESRSRLNRFPAAPAPTWATLVAQDVDACNDSFVKLDAASLQVTATAWVEQAPSRIEQAVLQAIGRPYVGGAVTVALLERLRSHINEVIGELEEEAHKLDRQAQRRDEGIRGALSMLGASDNIGASHPQIDEALKRGIRTLEWSSESRLRSLTCTLLRDLAENLVVPLCDRLANELSALQVDEHPPTGRDDSVIGTWPSGDVVPATLGSAINERLVEEPDTFPGTFRSLVSATIGTDRVHDAEATAVSQLITNTRVATGQAGTLVGAERVEPLDLGAVLEVSSNWWPTEFGRIKPSSKARYEIHLRAGALLDRGEQWVGRRDSAIGAFVHESLRDYLTKNANPGELAQRQARFLEVFTSALKLSTPLIGVSSVLLRAAHDQTEAPLVYTFTEIPLDQTDVQEEVLKIMRTMRVLGAEQESSAIGKIFGTGPQQSIEIITFFLSPYQPLVFDSIMKPIAKEWERRRLTPDGVQRFWQWRRARPLTSFVPVGPITRRAMVSGWFVARLFGELTYGDSGDFQPIEILIPGLKRTLPFPSPLLGPRVMGEKDLLAAVLESMPLAIVACNTEATLDPLLPYRRLIELGTESEARQLLRDWVVKGTTPAASEPMERAFCPPNTSVARADSTAAQRKDAVLAYLEGRRVQYVERLSEVVVDLHGFFDIPRYYELRDDYAQCIEALIRMTTAIEITNDDDNGD
jgi:hypothetical protein